jgi:cell division protein ZapA (FtsZ GTPase activity inhibitor)
MLTQKVDLVIKGRRISGVEMEGLTELEIHALAERVGNVMEDVEAKTKVVDSSKLAILTALEIAAELQRLESAQKDKAVVDERKLEGMIVSLEDALAPASEK